MIVSFIAVALLVAATSVWIAGLIQFDMDSELYFRSSEYYIWAEVGLFFAFFCFFTSGCTSLLFFSLFSTLINLSWCKLCDQDDSAHQEFQI